MRGAFSVDDWQRWVTRSRVFRIAVVLMLMLLVFMLGWSLSLQELRHSRRDAQGQGDDALEAMAAGMQQVEGLEGARRALSSARQLLQDAQWRLDAGEGMSELLDQLASSGHEHGLVFERIDVLDEELPGDGYRRVPLDIQVAGRYPSLRSWLEQWLRQVRLLEVANLSLVAQADSPGVVSARMRVHAYGATQALDPPASLADEPARPAVPASAFDPFRAWGFAASDDGPQRIPLEQMEMVGSLSRAGRHQAVVRAAGRLHRIHEGQRLGRDEGVVIRIDADRMEVRERLYMAGGWQERSRYLALVKRTQGGGTDDDEAVVVGDGDGAADERGGDSGSHGRE